MPTTTPLTTRDKIVKSRDLFPPMATVVPEGTHGVATVRHFDVSLFDSQMTAFHGGRHFVPPGQYASLSVRGELVMSDTPYERRTNTAVVRHAQGRVLIAGYGLGMVLTAVLTKPEVRDVVVVEREADVVALVDPHIRRYVGVEHARKLSVVTADIFEARSLLHGTFDCLWFDIWGDTSTDTLAEMSALTRKYRALRREGAFMECWGREWLRYRREQDRKAAV